LLSQFKYVIILFLITLTLISDIANKFQGGSLWWNALLDLAHYSLLSQIPEEIMPTIQPTPLSPVPASDTNVEQVKYFTFNQTGNIMISTTAQKTDKIEDDVRAVFNEVCVFFAAMTKAIASTNVPGSNPPTPYSLYDYDALYKVIAGSGLFIHMTEEDITYTSQSFGMNFSKDLISALLGLASGAGELSFASGLIASIGQQGLNISESSTSSSNKVANIVFVCEYLLGIPLVSAIVVSVDANEVSQTVTLGPCIKESSTQTTMSLHKDVYLFVSPTFIKQYAGDLDSIIGSAAYNEFIQYLQDLLSGLAMITAVTDAASNPAPTNLDATVQYSISGVGFGSVKGILTLGPASPGSSVNSPPTNQLNIMNWGQELVTFLGWATACKRELPCRSISIRTICKPSWRPHRASTR
jgi:hypothetical protein